MLEQITIGEVAVAVTFLVGLIGGLGYLRTHLKDWVGHAVKGQLDEIEKTVNELNKRIETVDAESTKNFLVKMLGDIDRGETLNDVQLERFWEQYEHYRHNGGNSYIKRKVDQFQEDGKL